MRIMMNASEPLAQKLLDHGPDGCINLRLDSYGQNYEGRETLLAARVTGVTLHRNRWDASGIHRVPDMVEVELLDVSNDATRGLLAWPEPAV